MNKHCINKQRGEKKKHLVDYAVGRTLSVFCSVLCVCFSNVYKVML